MGLGNPGLRFRFTRHNLGFSVVERLARLKKIKITRRAFGCLIGEGIIGSQRLLLAKPLTYVNLSGQAVGAIVRQKKIKPEDLLIVCDDVNLPLGKIRIKARGSDGGHKGLRSIIKTLESRDFPRLRVGIGTPEAEKDRLTEYVLGKFNKQEIKVIKEAIEEAVSCAEVWTKEGVAAAMNRFN